jgi:hypothetical protein
MVTQKTFYFLAIIMLSLPLFALAIEGPELSGITGDTGGEERGNEKTVACCVGQPSMVAADDGGVVVLVGRKLKKYDNALNLVREVSLVDAQGE